MKYERSLMLNDLSSTEEGLSYDQKQAVICWLVANMAARDDDNSLFSAFFFRRGRLSWHEYLESDQIVSAKQRLSQLRIITINKYTNKLELTNFISLPTNWLSFENVYLLQSTAQSLYYIFCEQAPQSQKQKDIMTLLHLSLIPKLSDVIVTLR